MLKQRLTDSLPIDNIGDLNKKQYSVNAETALVIGGESFKRRVAAERIVLGFSDDDNSVFAQQSKVLSANNIAMGAHNISGTIKAPGNIPAQNVIVRLQLILPQDSLYSNNVEEVENEPERKYINGKKKLCGRFVAP